jgi:hypothetical protein
MIETIISGEFETLVTPLCFKAPEISSLFVG